MMKGWLLLTLLFFSCAASAQISRAFYIDLPDSLRPADQGHLSSVECASILRNDFLFFSRYKDQLNLVAETYRKQINTLPNVDAQVKKLSTILTYYFNSAQDDLTLRLANDLLTLMSKDRQDYGGLRLRTTTFKGFALLRLGAVEDGILFVNEALAGYKARSDSFNIYQLNMSLSDTYRRIELFDEAMAALDSGGVYYANHKPNSPIQYSLDIKRSTTWLMRYEREKRVADKVLIEQTLFRILASPAAFRYRSMAFVNLSGLKSIEHDYPAAAAYADSALLKNNLKECANPELVVTMANYNKGVAWLKTGQHAKGYKLLQQLLNNWGGSVASYSSMELLMDLYLYAKSQGLWHDAMTYHELYAQVRDSLDVNRTRGLLIRENNRAAIRKSKAEIHSLQVVNQEQQRQTIYLGIILVLILIIVVMVYFSMQRKRQYELIRLEHELTNRQQEALLGLRKKISGDMHDDLSSSLAGLRYYLMDLKMQASAPETQEILGHLEEEVNAIYKTSRTYIHQLKDSSPEVIYDLTAYLKGLAERGQANTSLAIDVHFDATDILLRLDAHQQFTLYHIIKEAVTNVRKHANASRVVIKLKLNEEEGQSELEITDNGVGFDTQDPEMHHSMGLSNLRNRTEDLKGELILTSTGNGTVIRIVF